ncbi:EamA family transporter [uncultured Bilophila sp.]|uniref:EamA family transporter n=1 Tax=uncultured Bilophila sp. TaxID=529385 RepID=UPI0026DDA5BF|nr:EamA family transporter [uncultured Bilophila sp.]
MKLTTTSPFFSVALLLVSMLSIQCSASLAKTVFPMVGPAATTALRLLFAALVLLPVMRPWRAKLTLRDWQPIILYGLSTGIMNMCFYQAISRIPLGVGVALEFTGPLATAMIGSRRPVDFLWIALAMGGLYLLLPIHEFSGNLDPVGVAFALGAGFCWAMYIFFGKRAGNAGGEASVSLGMIVGACAAFPFGFAAAGTSMFSLSVLPLALLLGIFSSALPYALEIVALKQLPSQTFGILMSLEPVLAALSGFVFLGERLTFEQWIALACIIVASIGATMTIRKR